MRSFFLSCTVMLMTALILTDCAEDVLTAPDLAGGYRLVADPATKTINNGLGTEWSASDAINVFHAKAGTASYSANTKFIVEDPGTGEFYSDRLNGSLSSSNDWYVLYPYNEEVDSPSSASEGDFVIGAAHNGFQTQTGADGMSHIAGPNYPMWGVARDVESDGIPSVSMTHLTSLIEVMVKNDTDSELKVESVSFTAPEDIVGRYRIDITSDTPKFVKTDDAAVSDKAVLNVSGGASIPAGGSSAFYLAVKPFVAAAGRTLKLQVNGVEKVLELGAEVIFAPGGKKTMNFMYEDGAEDQEDIIYSSNPLWESARSSTEVIWIPESFRPGSVMSLGGYTYYIKVPRGLTAYVLSASDVSLTGGDAGLKLSVKEKIDAVIKSADKPRDVTMIVDRDKYASEGPPNGCEYYHYEHGCHLYAGAVIWASEEFHDSVCDCKERLPDEGKRNGVIVPINQVRYLNDGTEIMIVNNEATGSTETVVDKVFVVYQDLNGRFYEAIEINVPVEYFKGS